MSPATAARGAALTPENTNAGDPLQGSLGAEQMQQSWMPKTLVGNSDFFKSQGAFSTDGEALEAPLENATNDPCPCTHL
jgi:hypothetical protein